MTADHFDPVTLEVIRNRLDMISEEMQLTLLRSSCSPIVKEGLDASASLFTVDGTTLAQACAIPIHLATLIPAVAEITRCFPTATMREGDIYMLNDPYAGGTHLPDIALVVPVFADGRLIALAATMTHHQDVGGLAAGSVPTNATEIYQEGLRLPAVAWAREGVFDATLTAVLRANVRIPDVFIGDLHAQVAACRLGATRLAETAARHGAATLLAAFRLLIDRSEAMTRAALRAMPAGTWSAEDWLDNDGIALETPLRIAVTATVRDGTIHFDLSGSSVQTRGPVNAVPSGSLAAACFVVRAVTDPAIPSNGGCFRPITLTLPEGSIVNPRLPAPVNARSATIKRITGCMLRALAGAVPERMPAPSAGELLVMAFGGLWANGAPFVTGELLAGGSGAGPGFDGVDAIETDATNCMNLPAEAMELEAPIRVRRWSLRAGSGGAGRHRGGRGQVKEYEILPAISGPLSFSHRGERHAIAAAGLADGGPGARAVSTIMRANGSVEVIASKCVTSLGPGDRVIVETAGGGGWGSAALRDTAAIAIDRAEGRLIEETAA
jgi:N-methylhydantoinase B